MKLILRPSRLVRFSSRRCISLLSPNVKQGKGEIYEKGKGMETTWSPSSAKNSVEIVELLGNNNRRSICSHAETRSSPRPSPGHAKVVLAATRQVASSSAPSTFPRRGRGVHVSTTRVHFCSVVTVTCRADIPWLCGRAKAPSWPCSRVNWWRPACLHSCLIRGRKFGQTARRLRRLTEESSRTGEEENCFFQDLENFHL